MNKQQIASAVSAGVVAAAAMVGAVFLASASSGSEPPSPAGPLVVETTVGSPATEAPMILTPVPTVTVTAVLRATGPVPVPAESPVVLPRREAQVQATEPQPSEVPGEPTTVFVPPPAPSSPVPTCTPKAPGDC